MTISADEAVRVEAAFAAAQARTAAPIVCVLAHASTAYETLALLAASVLALVAPWPLIVFTELSAQRIFLAQLLVGVGAAALLSFGSLRRFLTPRRLARADAYRAALAQFSLRGLAHSQTGVLIYVSLAERYCRVLVADEAARAISADRWRGVVEAATRALKAGAVGEALEGAAAHSADLLARAFPPAEASRPQKRQHFHML